ncbi:hypothetical protein HGM15179_011321 [Zosterops borbonicus]|uniref:Uncharacterized protein n=1 Tax=Zosterops borbonicus TaxID=364589 RepID=A0A8K1LJ23_9PASS|nr:hypothetical protein HGM15179_011321 [Zosterops borbonicus]
MEEKNVNLEMLYPGDAGNYEEGSQGEALCIVQELSPAETTSYHNGAPVETCIEQELSPAETTSYNEGSQGEACIEQELSPAETSSYHQKSQGEACTGEVLSLEEANMLSVWD